ncbi:MAG: 2,3-bisphosphoglycerate-independent phosphoglycerate mutase [Flavobacteriales bacterium]|nr:2,3-bisphosphoglycerate-independent phosphoglycerate mutase [Flavobacteriales bacterium]
MNNGKKVCLIILDGWGNGDHNGGNAVFMAKTPFADYLNANFPHAELRTDGENVGLPDGQMGNSEVGHMNIGAGRIVYQDLVKINIAIRDGSFAKHPVLLRAFQDAKDGGKNVHLLGLVSDGGVHSHINHLLALCDLAKSFSSVKTFVHAFTDGRDTDPKSGEGFMQTLENHIQHSNVYTASIVGRYFAMDRDKRWERVRKAYDLLVAGTGKKFMSSADAIRDAYANDITDEFIEPSVIVDSNHQPLGVIGENDVVICFNFRTDRCREITQVLTQTDFPDFGMKRMSLNYVTMTNYDDSFKGVKVVYDKDNLTMTLGEVLEKNNRTQIRIAETEKYPHVTFFFSGGREKEFVGERRIMIPSPKVATYDLQPEMSAQGIADAICEQMKSDPADFICLNFANPDMVGHTGVFEAIVKAVETTDRCLQQVVETGLSCGYSFIVIADHGNADFAVNDDGSPNTAHSTNPVPVWVIDRDVKKVKNGILADVAPTVLQILGLSKPSDMNRTSIIEG